LRFANTKTIMTEVDQTPQKGDNWYEDFLANFDYETPQPGKLLEGIILRIDDEGALIDVGVKRDAVVPAKDLSQVNPEILESLSQGDHVWVYVLNRPVGDRELIVSLSKGMDHESWEKAEEYLEKGVPLQLEVIGHNRGGLIVEFETLRGFLPYSQVPSLRGIRSPRLADKLKREMVNTSIDMKVIEVVRERNRLIFSASAAEEEKRLNRLEELEKGNIITGRVVNIVDFGLFVDLDGIDGLVHLSELDWKRVKHPSELYQVGEEINVKVLEVDTERQRVSLSRKALIPSPWEIPEELPNAGDCIEGRVVKVVNFGAFIELPVGIEGLIHTSQLGYTHLENPKDAVKRNEIVLVRVLEVDPERRRISLSMRQVPRELQISWAIEHLDDIELGLSTNDENADLAEIVREEVEDTPVILSQEDNSDSLQVDDSAPEPVPDKVEETADLLDTDAAGDETQDLP